MLHMISKQENGAFIQFDLHAIRMPDGQLAHKLDGAELFRRLTKLGVPGVDCHDGQQRLLELYAEFLAAKMPELGA